MRRDKFQTFGYPARRRWATGAALSIMLHAGFGALMLVARTEPPTIASAPEPAPVIVSLEPPPPPTPAPSESPPPGPPDDAQPAAGPPEPAPQAKVAPPPPIKLRPPRLPPPPAVETLPVPPTRPTPPAVFPTVSDSALAGAITAGRGRGGGAGGTGGGGGGQGAGCDLVQRIQDALRTDPDVRVTVGQAHRAAGSRGALLVWNGDWVRAPGEVGKGLAGVRQAIALEVAFAPEACRDQAMRGLVLVSFADGSRVAMGRSAWRWTDLLS